MNSSDQIPVLIAHVLEADVPKDTGIVEQHVDSAIGLDGCFDDLVAILNAVVVGYRLAACGLDLVDNYISGLGNVRSSHRHIRDQVRGESTLLEVPSPLNDPPKSLTTTLAPLEPKNKAYA
jgi:hypothetical protein